MLIEQSLLAGRVQEALELYRKGMGGFENLGWVLGENSRGLRILERFFPRDEFSVLQPHLALRDQCLLLNELGQFLKNMGDLDRARRAFLCCRRSNEEPYPDDESDACQILADVEMLAGHFPQALEYCEIALASKIQSSANRASVQSFLGYIAALMGNFQRFVKREGGPLLGLLGIWEAECRMLHGDRPGARRQIEANREYSLVTAYNGLLCRCNAILACLLCADVPAQASQYLRDAQDFANRSGVVELRLRCYRSSLELQHHLADYAQALSGAKAGILLADTCGFGRHSIDLRLALAETLIAVGDAHKALQNARNALDRSEQPDCQYAWGKADGLHFCGVAHLLLGEIDLARQRLTAALELRERLGHGRIDETRRALDRCSP